MSKERLCDPMLKWVTCTQVIRLMLLLTGAIDVLHKDGQFNAELVWKQTQI